MRNFAFMRYGRLVIKVWWDLTIYGLKMFVWLVFFLSSKGNIAKKLLKLAELY